MGVCKKQQNLSSMGIEAAVLDLRTTSPLDEVHLEFAEETGRIVSWTRRILACIAADISSIIAEKGFSSLKAPIRKIT